MRARVAGVIAGCALVLAGCEGVQTAAQSKTVQGAAMGSALGAGAGAIIGHQTHNAGAGTAIGAALGALGGGLMGSSLEAQDKKIQQLQTPPATAQPSTTTTTGAQTKFCPVGGEIYPESIKYCPNHGVELRYKEQ